MVIASVVQALSISGMSQLYTWEKFTDPSQLECILSHDSCWVSASPFASLQARP
jgi:hypothetical protein